MDLSRKPQLANPAWCIMGYMRGVAKNAENAALKSHDKPLRMCRLCRQKTSDYYTPKRNYIPGVCRRCHLERDKRYSQTPEGRSSRMFYRYGITLAQYHELLNKQGGGCAICGRLPNKNKRRLPIDHCHKTGKVRGILCVFCNIMLGHFEDNVHIFRRVIRYLRG
jgi:hypothetical protein